MRESFILMTCHLRQSPFQVTVLGSILTQAEETKFMCILVSVLFEEVCNEAGVPFIVALTLYSFVF